MIWCLLLEIDRHMRRLHRWFMFEYNQFKGLGFQFWIRELLLLARGCRKENPSSKGFWCLVHEMDSDIHENVATESCFDSSIFFLSLLLNTFCKPIWNTVKSVIWHNGSLCFGGKVEHSLGARSCEIFAEVFVLWLLSSQITLHLSREILQFLWVAST